MMLMLGFRDAKNLDQYKKELGNVPSDINVFINTKDPLNTDTVFKAFKRSPAFTTFKKYYGTYFKGQYDVYDIVCKVFRIEYIKQELFNHVHKGTLTDDTYQDLQALDTIDMMK